MRKTERYELRLTEMEKTEIGERAKHKEVTPAELIRGVLACTSFEGCNAPICPLDPSFKKAVWYAVEDICSAKKYRKEHWRVIQRKIAKVNAKRPVPGCFLIKDLEAIKRVAHGISGNTRG